MAPPPKNETAAKPAAESAVDATAHAKASQGGGKAWLPAIAALLLAPAATWATVEYVLVPRLQKKLAGGASEQAGVDHAAAAHVNPAAHGKSGKEGKDSKDGGPGYEFQNVIVNLAGTMGTRYLKTSFLITGANPNIKAIFDGAKPKLMDLTLNVLSSLTLADLEEAGAKNVIREKLVSAYNQALGRKVADQVYFSDFVIQ